MRVFPAFTLCKENLETLEAISYMAAALGVLPSDFTYAGIKDKRAITYQSMVVKKVSPQRYCCVSFMHFEYIFIYIYFFLFLIYKSWDKSTKRCVMLEFFLKYYLYILHFVWLGWKRRMQSFRTEGSACFRCVLSASLSGLDDCRGITSTWLSGTWDHTVPVTRTPLAETCTHGWQHWWKKQWRMSRYILSFRFSAILW